MFQFIVIATCLAAVHAGYPQFYYSAPAPVHHQPYYQPVAYHQALPYQQTYVPQYVPQTPIVQTFGYHHPLPVQFNYNNVQQEQAQATTPTPVSNNEETTTPEDDSVVTNVDLRSNTLTVNNFDSFRGFGYRNDYEGGRSHFVFITGPEAQRLRQPSNNLASRTAASDAVDTVATTTPDHSLDALYQYLEHPDAGVQRFYSVNNAIVTRRLEDEIPPLPALPAAPVGNLRVQPIAPIFPFIRANYQAAVQKEETTTTAAATTEKEEHEASASIIEAKSIAPETTVTPVATTEAATTTTTTTEAAPSTTAAATTTEKSTMAPIIVE